MLRILLNPKCWFRGKPTSKALSKFINEAIDNKLPLKVSDTTITINGLELWKWDYPYNFGYPIKAPVIGLPDRTTVFKLYDYYISKLEGYYLK